MNHRFSILFLEFTKRRLNFGLMMRSHMNITIFFAEHFYPNAEN